MREVSAGEQNKVPLCGRKLILSYLLCSLTTMVKIHAATMIVIVGVFGFAVLPLLAQILTDTVSYSLANNEGVVFTPVEGANINAGYVRVTSTASTPLPAMTEILGFRPSGILTMEFAIPSAPSISSGRLHVRRAGPSAATGA